jgi:hypothetical protein
MLSHHFSAEGEKKPTKPQSRCLQLSMWFELTNTSRPILIENNVIYQLRISNFRIVRIAFGRTLENIVMQKYLWNMKPVLNLLSISITELVVERHA